MVLAGRAERAAMVVVVAVPGSLMPALTVLRNVTLPLAFAKEAAPPGQTRAIELLDMVGLGDRLDA